MIASVAPGVPVADISHLVPSYDIERGARLLESAIPYYPAGSVHLGVVDPGVGTPRRGIALRSERGDVCIGPDNGLLIWGVERLGGVSEAVELTSDSHRLRPTSQTFHGRDIFSPAAAHVAVGTPLTALGPTLDPATLVRLPRPEPEVTAGGRIRARVGVVNVYGTCQLDLAESDWNRSGLGRPSSVMVQVGGWTWVVPYVRTFGEASQGDPLLFTDSSGKVSLAVNRGSAAKRFGLEAGAWVGLRPAEGSPPG